MYMTSEYIWHIHTIVWWFCFARVLNLHGCSDRWPLCHHMAEAESNNSLSALHSQIQEAQCVCRFCIPHFLPICQYVDTEWYWDVWTSLNESELCSIPWAFLVLTSRRRFLHTCSSDAFWQRSNPPGASSHYDCDLCSDLGMGKPLQVDTVDSGYIVDTLWCNNVPSQCSGAGVSALACFSNLKSSNHPELRWQKMLSKIELKRHGHAIQESISMIAGNQVPSSHFDI